MPKTPRSVNFSFLLIVLALSTAPLFQNCSSQIDFGKTDNFALEQGLAELVDFHIDPNSWDSKPNINVVAIVDNSNSMAPIQEKVAVGLEQSLDPLSEFAGRLELYTTTQAPDPVLNRTEEELKLSVVEEISSYNGSNDPDEFVKSYRLPTSFTIDSTDTRRALYYNPENMAQVKQNFGDSIRYLGTEGSQDEQGICSLMRAIASQSTEEQTQYAFVLVSNEDDATDVSSCLEEFSQFRQNVGGTLNQNIACNERDLYREECSVHNKIHVAGEKDETKLLATYKLPTEAYAASSDTIRRNRVRVQAKRKQLGYTRDTRSCNINMTKTENFKTEYLAWAQRRFKWKKQYLRNRVNLTAVREGTFTYEGSVTSQNFQENIGIVVANSCEEVSPSCTQAHLNLYNGKNYEIDLGGGNIVDATLTNKCSVSCSIAEPEWVDQTAYQTENGLCEQYFGNDQVLAGKTLHNDQACVSSSCRYQCTATSNSSSTTKLVENAAGTCDGNTTPLANATCNGGISCEAFCAKDDISCNSNIACEASGDTTAIAKTGYTGESCSSFSNEENIAAQFSASEKAGCGSTHTCNFSRTNNTGSAEGFTAFSGNRKIGVCNEDDLAEARTTLSGMNCQDCNPSCKNDIASEQSFYSSYALGDVCLRNNSLHTTSQATIAENIDNLLGNELFANETLNAGYNATAKLGELVASDIYRLRFECNAATKRQKQAAPGVVNTISSSDLASYTAVECDETHNQILQTINSWYNTHTGSSRDTYASDDITCYKKTGYSSHTLVNNERVSETWAYSEGTDEVVIADNCDSQIPSGLLSANFPDGAVNRYCKLSKHTVSNSVSCQKIENMKRAGASQAELEEIANALCDGEVFNSSDWQRISYSSFKSTVVGSYNIEVNNTDTNLVNTEKRHLNSLDAESIKSQIQNRLGTLEGINFASFITPPENTPAFDKCLAEAEKYNSSADYNPFAPGTLYNELMNRLGADKASSYSVCEEDYVSAFQEIVNRVVAEAEFSYKISLAEYENVYKVFLVKRDGSSTELKPYMYFVKDGLINIEPSYYNLLDEAVSSIKVQIYRDLQAKEELERSPASTSDKARRPRRPPGGAAARK